MNEQTKAIIDRARALLTAATPGPWEVCPDLRPDIRSQSGTGGFLGCGHIATVSRYDANESDAALIAAAPELLAVLCDALERSQFALEWWAADRAIEIEALREAWAAMDSMARAADVVGAFLEQAAPLLRPDASGNVKAPNYVTAAFTDGVQSYEVTIRREGGKTPAEIIGELTARAESAERRVEEAEELYRSIKAKVGQTPGDGRMVHDAIDALTRRAEEAEAQAAAMREALKLECDARYLNEACDRHAQLSVIGKSGGVEANACDVHAQALLESEGGVRVVRYDTVVSRALSGTAGRALLERLHAAEARVAEVEAAQKMRAESADPDDETWRTREEYLRRVKAEARVADLESVREEQAAKLRRHLDEIVELQERAGIAEGREAAAKANAEQMAGWLDARNAGLVQMARERDALRDSLASVTAECGRLRSDIDLEREQNAAFVKEIERLRVVEAGAAIMRRVLNEVGRHAEWASTVRECLRDGAGQKFLEQLVSTECDLAHAQQELEFERKSIAHALDAAHAEVKSLRARVAHVCAGCHGRGLAHLDWGSPRCAACGGNGAVIVDGVTVAHALTVAEVQRESYDTARAKGWHEEDDQPPSEAMMRIAAEGLYQSARCRFIEAYRRGERGDDALAGVDPMGTMATLSDRQVRVIAWMALVNTEVAEAIEDVVAGRWGTTKNEKGKPEGLGSELADIVIRVCDSAGALGIDMEAELRAKLAFNRTRSHKHGGKLA